MRRTSLSQSEVERIYKEVVSKITLHRVIQCISVGLFLIVAIIAFIWMYSRDSSGLIGEVVGDTDHMYNLQFAVPFAMIPLVFCVVVSVILGKKGSRLQGLY